MDIAVAVFICGRLVSSVVCVSVQWLHTIPSVVHCHFFLLHRLGVRQTYCQACGQEVTACSCVLRLIPHDTVRGMPRLPASPVQLLPPH